MISWLAKPAADMQNSYSEPQFLENGVVAGHTHVTVQDLQGSFTPKKP
jgi:hypothetical protein